MYCQYGSIKKIYLNARNKSHFLYSHKAFKISEKYELTNKEHLPFPTGNVQSGWLVCAGMVHFKYFVTAEYTNLFV